MSGSGNSQGAHRRQSHRSQPRQLLQHVRETGQFGKDQHRHPHHQGPWNFLQMDLHPSLVCDSFRQILSNRKPQVLCDKEPKGSAYAACLTRTKGPHLLFFMKSIHQANECLMGRPVPEHGPAGTGVPGTTQDHTPGTQSTTQAPPNSTGIKPMDVDGKRSTPAANSMGPLVYAVPPPRRVRLLYSFL